MSVIETKPKKKKRVIIKKMVKGEVVIPCARDAVNNRSRAKRENIVNDEHRKIREAAKQRTVKNIPKDPKVQAKLLKSMWDHPVDTIYHLFGIKLWDKQIEVVESVRRNHFTTVRSGNAVGKTYVVAAIAVLFLITHRPGYVILTSAGWREVEFVLWPQIHELIKQAEKRLGIKIGNEANNTFWYPDEKDKRWAMIGVAAKDKNNFAGFHNADMLVIGDEADGISEEIIHAIFGNATGENDRVLLTGNPHTPGSAFYNTFRSEVWNHIHISCLDHPNVVTGKEIIKGAVTKRWVEMMTKELGLGTPAYSSRIKGDFPEQDELQLIPLSWIEQAGKREIPPIDWDSIRIGADIARSASGDKTCFVVRDNYAIRYVEEHQGLDTMGCVGRLLHLSSIWKPKSITLDDSNMGGGVYDRMKEISGKFKEYGVDKIIGINFAEKAENPKRFFNQRSECYWGVKEILAPANEFAIPKEHVPKFLELAIVRIKPASHGKIQLESKDEIKLRLKGKSPDRADAFALSCSCRVTEKISSAGGSVRSINLNGYGRG